MQSIAIQCLEALQFLHGLGLIHCDLKPENILVKSYSRCEIKVIDLGSSCFETDHLCSYVQSRSYRAPEVILGLPYDKKIDIWSLGCILAELCTGNVLLQNDSPATLLARVMGIIGSIEQAMLAQGRDTYKYFTKNHMLYERNQESNRLEYLIPKKTSLRHRLPMADQGFIEFVAYLLEVNPKKRPSASEALKHPWLSFPYEPISSWGILLLDRGWLNICLDTWAPWNFDRSRFNTFYHDGAMASTKVQKANPYMVWSCLGATIRMGLFGWSVLGFSRLVLTYFLSQNTIYSTSRTLFILPAKQAIVWSQHALCCACNITLFFFFVYL